MAKHLFVCVPNNSGSSLMNRALGRCRLGIPLTGPDSMKEGQRFFQPGGLGPIPNDLDCKRVWTERGEDFADPQEYDWPRIRERWYAAWREFKPDVFRDPDRVLIEKSPPNVVRARLLSDVFPDSYFILSLRNPYAVAEGIRRRNGYDLERCARHWVRCAALQEENLSALEHVVRTTYEELCEHPQDVAARIIAMLPELADLNFVSGDPVSRVSPTLSDLNDRQLSRLSAEDRKTLTRTLRMHEALLQRWGYTLLD